MNFEYVKLLKSLVAAVPDYVENYGKVTRIYLTTGEIQEVNFSLGKVLKDYCLIHYLNMKEIRKLAGNITGSKGLIPLYIRKDRILIPLKIREKKGDEERVSGFINIKEVEHMDLEKKIIIFKGGQKLTFYDKKTNVLKKLGQTQLLSEKLSALSEWQ